MPPKITAQEKNPQSETCSVKTHLKHVAVVCKKTSEPHAHSSGLEQKKQPIATFRMSFPIQSVSQKMTGGNIQILGGGFKYFSFSPLFGEDFQFD